MARPAVTALVRAWSAATLIYLLSAASGCTRDLLDQRSIRAGEAQNSNYIDGRPQQDSNLRTRLRSVLLKIVLTCANLALPVI